MKAVCYSSFGNASEVLRISDISMPNVNAGEVLVRIKNSGVNPSDVKARAGGRPGVNKPPFPMIVPHSDGAGVIEDVGTGVDKNRIGQRVWIWNGQWQRAFGTAAEYIVLPEYQAVLLPDEIGFEQGATLGIPGLTAVHAVLGGGNIEGQTLLVSGGAGTVGRLAIQVAKLSGAHVLTTVGSDVGKELALSAGADQVFDYADPNLSSNILDATGGGLVNRVLEVEFGQNILTNSTIIAEQGTIVSFGSAKDRSPIIPFYELMFKAVKIELVLVYLLDRQSRNRAIENLTFLLTQQKLDIRIDRVLSLEDCEQAHRIVESGERTGAVLLEI